MQGTSTSSRNHGIYLVDLGHKNSFYIDLGKIVSVSRARFVDRMGSGGYYAEALIRCQLLDKHIHIMLEPVKTAAGVPTAVEYLQSVLDELVSAWKEFNSHG